MTSLHDQNAATITNYCMRMSLAKRALNGLTAGGDICDCEQKNLNVRERGEHHFTCAQTFVDFAKKVLEQCNFTHEEIVKMYCSEDGK